ncbi:GNAT family N-acetyltransferase [Loktanella fryxellensis]|nr:GNAT family N-acetyltransferase [Loktanella fryxellensis]
MTHKAIRPATALDLPQLENCAARAFSPYIPLIGRKPAPMTADIAAQIAAGEVFVATDADDAVLGYIVFRTASLRMDLDTVAVRPDAAGRGLGRRLIAFCEDAARLKGLDSVHLHTNAAMAANVSLYSRLGYMAVARRHEDGFDRVYFTKDLN